MPTPANTIRAKFARLKRRAWRPLTEPGDGAATDSKYSGMPCLLPGEAWPLCGQCGNPLQLFLQINIATIPDEAKTLLGKSDGLLQMFYCTLSDVITDEWAPFSKAHLIRIIPPVPDSAPSVLPAAFGPDGKDYLAGGRITGWEPFDDYPSMQEESAEPLPELTEAEDYAYHMDEPEMNRGGEKLGGWPYWVQSEEYPSCPQCGTVMHMIYQLDSNDLLDWMWGDAGAGHITQCAAHRDVLAFGWACC